MLNLACYLKKGSKFLFFQEHFLGCCVTRIWTKYQPETLLLAADKKTQWEGTIYSTQYKGGLDKYSVGVFIYLFKWKWLNGKKL